MPSYCFINRTNLPSKNSQKVGTVVSADDLFTLKRCPEDYLTPCCDIVLFFVCSVIQSQVGHIQRPPDRLMSQLPTPFRDSPPDTVLSVSIKTQRLCPKGGFMYNPKSVNERSKAGRHKE